MKILKQFASNTRDRVAERGSALLVSLMVMVGLSLLGLGFVALSETESAISVNERNYTEVHHIAEAGGNMVVEWFQNPYWSRSTGLMPLNVDAIKVSRRLKIGDPSQYIGRYKPIAADLLCNKPFKPNNENRFYGTEQNPDILINDKTQPSFLTTFNIALFNTNGAPAAPASFCVGCDNNDGRVTEIRIYAPPINGGVLNNEDGWTTPATSGIPPGKGFYEGGSRFGLATIRVTASRFNRPECGPYTAGCQALATRSVKFVVTEYPFPGPNGPVQSNASVGTNGNMKVHWGKTTASIDITVKRPYVGLPWHDAYEHVNFERGYDDFNYPVLTAVSVPPTASFKDRFAWLNELVGRDFEDPWYEARSRGRLDQLASIVDAHETRYDLSKTAIPPNSPFCNPCGSGKADSTKAPGMSIFFQFQNVDDGCTSAAQLDCDHRQVIFPKIDYNFWKQIAIAGDDQSNIFYLKWTSADNFADKSGCTQSFESWVNTRVVGTCGTPVPGFYFFDTKNAINPQNSGGGTLTPGISVNGGGKGNFLMQGFIYLNTVDFGTTGLSGPVTNHGMPGEPYRDVGFWEIERDSSLGPLWKDWKRLDPTIPCVPTTGANCVMYDSTGSSARRNGRWDFEDLSWGPTAGVFDYHVTHKDGLAGRPAIPVRSSAPAILAAESWFVDPYFPGCVIGTNCSEPHEPYLNYVYPTVRTGTTTMRSSDPASAADMRPKRETSPGTLVTCTTASPRADCTSNAYDADGGMVPIPAIMDGVFYNEGTVSSTGNAEYFGSILVQGNFTDTGTPDVWFDERLIKNAWPPATFGFPRVFVSSVQTDQ